MNQIKENYKEIFFSEISEKIKEEIYFDQFMWHAFSFGKIRCFEGEKAIKEFEKRKDNKVYIFFEHNDILIEKENLTLEGLFDLIDSDESLWDDCYVVDKDFSWTFVTTHETIYGEDKFHYIGPFFKDVNN